jgi:hypothetical protein
MFSVKSNYEGKLPLTLGLFHFLQHTLDPICRIAGKATRE